MKIRIEIGSSKILLILIFLAASSFSFGQQKPSAPIITPGSSGFGFLDSVTVKIQGDDPSWPIYYTLDETSPTTSSTRYTGHFVLKETTTVKAICSLGDSVSRVQTMYYGKISTGLIRPLPQEKLGEKGWLDLLGRFRSSPKFSSELLANK